MEHLVVIELISQGISPLSRKSEAQDHVYESHRAIILSQLNPCYNFTPCFLFCMPRFSNWFLSLRLWHQSVTHILISNCMLHVKHISLFVSIKISHEEYKLWNIPQCNCFPFRYCLLQLTSVFLKDLFSEVHSTAAQKILHNYRFETFKISNVRFVF
jgi:hypothetical protein